jgi:Ca2+-binding RTX toxin-like protein
MTLSRSLTRKYRSILAAARAFWRDSGNESRPRARSKRLTLEVLEDRVTPTVTVAFDAATGTVGLFNQTAPETIAYAQNGGNLQLTATTNNIAVSNAAQLAGITGNGTKVVNIPGNLIRNLYVTSDPTQALSAVPTADFNNTALLPNFRYYERFDNNTANANTDYSAINNPNLLVRAGIAGGVGRLVTAPTGAAAFIIQFADTNVNGLAGAVVPVGATLQINGLVGTLPTALDFGSGFYKTPGSNTSPLPSDAAMKVGGEPAAFTLVGGGMVSKATNVQVNLASQTTQIAQFGNLTISTAAAGQGALITAVYGGQGNDNITGNNAGDLLVGGGGNVTIIGGNGSNQLNACRTFDQSIKGDETRFAAAKNFVNAQPGIAQLTKIQFARFGVFDFGEGVQFLVNQGVLPPGTTNPLANAPNGPITVTVKGGTSDDSLFSFGNVGGQFIGNGGNDVYSGAFANGGNLASLPSTLDFEGVGNPIINAAAGDNVVATGPGNDLLFCLPAGGSNLVTHITGGTGNDIILDSSFATEVDPGTGSTTVIGRGGKDVVVRHTNTSIPPAGSGPFIINGVPFFSLGFDPASQFPTSPV